MLLCLLTLSELQHAWLRFADVWYLIHDRQSDETRSSSVQVKLISITLALLPFVLLRTSVCNVIQDEEHLSFVSVCCIRIYVFVHPTLGSDCDRSSWSFTPSILTLSLPQVITDARPHRIIQQRVTRSRASFGASFVFFTANKWPPVHGGRALPPREGSSIVTDR